MRWDRDDQMIEGYEVHEDEAEKEFRIRSLLSQNLIEEDNVRDNFDLFAIERERFETNLPTSISWQFQCYSYFGPMNRQVNRPENWIGKYRNKCSILLFSAILLGMHVISFNFYPAFAAHISFDPVCVEFEDCKILGHCLFNS